MRFLPSPNFNARKLPISLIVLHYTGMKDDDAALKWLCDPQSGVSAHYFIHQNGDIIQMVEDDQRAWHAGVSYWKGERDLNSASIGIEIANAGHAHGYHTFPEAQIEAVKTLCLSLMQRYHLSAHQIVAHSDIAPQRKMDPGELFPWQILAQDGVGLWPSLGDLKEKRHKPVDLLECQKLLKKIGYDVPCSGQLCVQTRFVIKAFQRRFLPHKIDGELCPLFIQSLLAFS